MKKRIIAAFLLVSMLFAGGMRAKHFAILLIPAILLGVFLILLEPYRLNRLSAFLNPWASPKGEGYQLLQSLYALGSGGWFGVGLFNSRQKYSFLPFAESDFILSVIGEEIGFIGLFLFFILSFILFITNNIYYSMTDSFFDFNMLQSKPNAMVSVDLSVKDDFSCVCYALYDSINKRFVFKKL